MAFLTPKSLVSLVSNEKRLINGGFLKLVSIYGVLSISDFGFPMVPHGSPWFHQWHGF